MPNGCFVAYYRVSTAKQGRSGLGIEAQKSAVASYLNGGDWKLIGEYTEVESGKVNDRPELAAAMDACRLTGAVLVIAKLDRLSRDAHFLLGLEKAGLDFVATDMPNANRLTVRLMAVIAQEEREMIAARTKAALQAAKAGGKRLGGWRATRRDGSPRLPAGSPALASAAASRQADEFARRVGPIALAMRDEGKSLAVIATAFRDRHIATSRGGNWTPMAVRNLLNRSVSIGIRPTDLRQSR